MGGRTAQATDVLAALQRAPAVRNDTPKRVGLGLPGEMSDVHPPTDHQDAIMKLSEYIDPTPGLTPLERADRFFGGTAPAGGESP
jgi:hypothetical protein